jgi:hypothetical protein
MHRLRLKTLYSFPQLLQFLEKDPWNMDNLAIASEYTRFLPEEAIQLIQQKYNEYLSMNKTDSDYVKSL